MPERVCQSCPNEVIGLLCSAGKCRFQRRNVCKKGDSHAEKWRLRVTNTL